jgi:hypothetical protein
LSGLLLCAADFSFSNPLDTIALVVFLATALLISRAAAQMHHSDTEMFADSGSYTMPNGNL